MKKIFVLALALCLAVPALSYAGNATSRFDMNIGGTLKIDVGWADDDEGGTLNMASFPARDIRHSAHEKYGQQAWGAGETGLNFFVRGPDAWGAKTSAFIAGDFTGFWGASGYNTFDLVIAQINFDWPNTSLNIGQSPQIWGKLPTWSQQLAWGAMNLSDKGSTPAVMNAVVTQRFTKEWSAKFGISSPWSFTGNYNTLAATAGPPPDLLQDFSRSDYPVFQGGVTYSSGACGKVGPWQLTFATDGFWGKFKNIYTNANGRASDKNVDGWAAGFKFLVPIIPEKNGNKAGALYVDGDIYTQQNAGEYAAHDINAYDRTFFDLPRFVSGSTNPELAAPVITTWAAHAAYYFTDQLAFNAYFSHWTAHTSRFFQANNTGTGKTAYQYIANLGYDVNPAIRFVVQYDYTQVKYPRIPGESSKGTNANYRFAAYYFF